VSWVNYVNIACVTIVGHLIVNNTLVNNVFILMCEVAFNALKTMKIYMKHQQTSAIWNELKKKA
jgi:hypothetical protein